MGETHNHTYKERFEHLFKIYLGVDLNDELTEIQKNILYDNYKNRFQIYNDFICPWAAKVIGESFGDVVEVGSGIGSSTQAIAPFSKHIHCFEIDKLTIPLLDLRMAEAGLNNYTVHQKTFSKSIADSFAGEIDGVFLPAVLEHSFFEECIEILQASWLALRPGGWLCVVDTPNRLTPIDLHTSMLPFFSALPLEVKLRYAQFSPRLDFAESFPYRDKYSKEDETSMVRWGHGISFHEFELALGRDIHKKIIADGYEPEINAHLSSTTQDTSLELILKMFAPEVHRAFSRRAFHFIAIK